jgi:hypothetical protein
MKKKQTNKQTNKQTHKHKGNSPDFGKSQLNNSGAQLKNWDVVLIDVFVKGNCSFIFKLKMKENEPIMKYGAPKEMWLVTNVEDAPKKGLVVDFEVE